MGGSMAMLLLWWRINYPCVRRKSELGWSETCRCVLGVTCNKPMRLPSSIPFKSLCIWLDELIFDSGSGPAGNPARPMGTWTAASASRFRLYLMLILSFLYLPLRTWAWPLLQARKTQHSWAGENDYLHTVALYKKCPRSLTLIESNNP